MAVVLKARPKKVQVKTDASLPQLNREYQADVPIRGLKYYFKNARRGNTEKVAESLKFNGQYKPIVVNRGTKTSRPDEILAGNHTVKAARSLGWKVIDVMWVDVSEEHARRINLADNGSTDDATYDIQILTALLDDQKNDAGNLVGTTYDDEILSKLMVEVNLDKTADVDRVEDAPADMDGVQDLNRYVYFESDADYDIPVLRLDMVPKKLPEPLDIWAGHELDADRQREEPNRWWMAQWHTGLRGINWNQSVLSLYTEDFHFYGVYEDPALNTKKILNLGIPMAIMPNFSVNPTDPAALWIYSVYRSFYVGRYWQEAGIQVIPDIQYGTHDDALDLCILGIPEGTPVASCQVQNARGDDTKIRTTARLLKRAEEKLGFKQLLVYGHTDADRAMDYAGLDCEVVRVSNRTARRRELLDDNGKQVRSKKSRRREED